MHDWTLVAVNLNWNEARLEMSVVDRLSVERCLLFEGVRGVAVERQLPWGPSNSINEVSLLKECEQGVFTVRFEMQSGDEITVTAGSCKLDQVQFFF